MQTQLIASKYPILYKIWTWEQKIGQIHQNTHHEVEVPILYYITSHNGIADPDQTTYKTSGSDNIYLMVKGFMVKNSFKKTE